MITVHKYVLGLNDLQTILAPDHSEFLHVAYQRENLCVWYRCDTDEKRRTYSVIISGTGHEAPPTDYRHVGTVLTPDGSFVWHVFVQ